MKQVLEAIERHLGRSLDVSQLDYYQVLDLEVFCEDANRIRLALQDATNRWMQSETAAYPESAQIVGKLLKQAQAILLDSSKRTLYDAQLAKLRASHQAASRDTTTSKTEAAVEAAAPTPSDQESLFPIGDPMTPFPLESHTWSSVETGGGTMLLTQLSDPVVRRVELEQLFPSLAEVDHAYDLPSASPYRSEQKDAPKSEARLEGGAAISLAEQLRRKRIRNRAWMAGAMVAFALLLLMGASLLYWNNRTQIAKREANQAGSNSESRTNPPAELPGLTKPNSDEAEDATTGRGSRGGKRNRGGRTDRVVSDLPSVGRDGNAASEMNANSEMQGMTPEAMPTTDAATKPANPSTTMDEATPKPNDADPKPMETTTPAPVPMGESDAWKASIQRARTALLEAKFEAFETIIAKAIESSGSTAGKEEALALDQLGQLYRIGHDSFEEAKKKAKGASSIKVGGNDISIVEVNAEKIVVRAAGKNQSHEWKKLPFGMASALSDLALSSDEPTDLAARAVYFSLTPAYRESAASNELIKKKINEWFEKSLGKGAVRPDLRQALTRTLESI